jgi:hypothetical protein
MEELMINQTGYTELLFTVSSENPVRLWIDCLLRKGIKKKINKIK